MTDNDLQDAANGKLTAEGPVEAPSGECPANGRGPDGRFRPGNVESFRHGLCSTRAQLALLPGQESLRAVLDEHRAVWVADLGGDLSFPQRDLVSRGLRLCVLLDTLEARMDREGVLTSRGRTRASVSLYLSVLDRLTRIYQQLGLQRRARDLSTMSLDEYIRVTQPKPEDPDHA